MKLFDSGILLCLLLLVGTCNSAPNIQSGQVLSLQQKVVIEGSGFGKSFNPMLLWDQATDLQALYPNNTQIPLTKWREVEALEFSKNNLVPHRNGKIATVYAGKGTACLLRPKYTTTTVYDKLYVSWWYRTNQDPFSEGGSNKYIRVWDEGNGYGTRISWTHMHLTCLNGTYWNSWPSAGKLNEWNHHEFYADLANSRVIAKVNGKTLFNVTCSKDTTYSANPIFVRLIGFDNGIGGYKNMTTALDGVFIGNSAKRIMLSHSSNWTQISLSEVLPIEEWTSTRIVANWIDGVLDLNKPLYAFVVDEESNVNLNGFPLKVCKQDCDTGSGQVPGLTPSPTTTTVEPFTSSKRQDNESGKAYLNGLVILLLALFHLF